MVLSRPLSLPPNYLIDKYGEKGGDNRGGNRGIVLLVKRLVY